MYAFHVTRRVYNILKLQGFLETKPVVPMDFFPYETITGDVDMNLPDANGMVCLARRCRFRASAFRNGS